MKTKPCLLVISLLTLGLNLSLQGAATRIAYVDAFATARGNAFTATADTPSAVFYNAAGLTQLEGTEVRGQVFAISLDYEFDGDYVGNSDMDDEFQVVPSFFVSHRFEDNPFAIGFGVYSPFALGSDWGSDASFTGPVPSPLATIPHSADLTYIKYHGVVAWQITDTLSIAGGLSWDESDVDIESNALEYDGNDNVFGYSLSVLWQPSKKHSFGLNYQAKTDVEYDGEVSGPAILGATFGATNSLDGKADLVFPESIVLGYSYRPNEKWNIEFNLDWTNWDRVDELKIDTGTPIPLSYDLNWESAFIWELGATRYLDNGWHVSAGYTFVENAVPDEDFLPIVPDSDRHFLSIGVGQDLENFSWMVAYQQAFDDGRSVSNSNYSPTIEGEYELDSQAIAASLSYRF